MNYQEKKQELIKLRKEILSDYQAFYEKTVKYAEDTRLENISRKVKSIIAAVLYIEHPDNKEVINALRQDIVDNKGERKENDVESSKNDEIIEYYKSLFIKSLKYSGFSLELANARLLPHEMVDFIKFISNDIESMKITSLLTALMYVEYPNNPEIVATLRRDMFMNKHGRK